jgi:threonylcarbamoyladenosine tRNA methylthiotransferase MtaB
VPLVRGRSRSRPLAEIIREARRLAKNGFKEIVLTGICLGSYGRDLKPGTNLVEAISALEKISGILRIRLSSIEAGDVSDELINKLAGSGKLCRHLHIPIQSGDDEVLKKMRRRYTRSYYLELIRKIKKKIPGIGLTTDCLVGFPGETEKNFENTLKLIKRINPLKVHIFPYSRREGTLAGSKLYCEIPALTVKKRIARLKNCAQACANDYKRGFLGARIAALFERESKEAPGYWEGYADNYIRVLLKSRCSLKNKLALVRLKSISGGCVLDKLLREGAY